ncbi:hypothetical protein QBC39DRAFT_81730 [Podospora conica]|nr:hypothetical protein QBC39DRAFT_81730 [Schizothecium conicum]
MGQQRHLFHHGRPSARPSCCLSKDRGPLNRQETVEMEREKAVRQFSYLALSRRLARAAVMAAPSHVVKPAAGLCCRRRGGTTVGSPQTICFLCPPGTGAPVAATGGRRPVQRWYPVRLAPPAMKKSNLPSTPPGPGPPAVVPCWHGAGSHGRDMVPPCDYPRPILLSRLPGPATRRDTVSLLLLQLSARACDDSRRTPFVPRDQREGGAGNLTTPRPHRPSASSGHRPTSCPSCRHSPAPAARRQSW